MSVFQCGNCKHDYNQTNKLPLSLYCGHVYCEECMYTFIYYSKEDSVNDEKLLRCPTDKKCQKYTDMTKIPRCYQILLNLPSTKKATNPNPATVINSMISNNKSNSLFCIRHPSKKLKFFCSNDHSYTCSICIKDHTESNHEVEKVEITFDKMFSEWNSLRKMIDYELVEVKELKEKLDKSERIISDFYQSLISKTEHSFEKLQQIINEKRKTIVDSMKSSCFENKSVIEFERLKINKKCDKLNSLTDNYKIIEDIFKKHNYEEFARIKSQYISEIKLINETKINLSFNELKFPSLTLHSDKIEEMTSYKMFNIYNEIEKKYYDKLKSSGSVGVNAGQGIQSASSSAGITSISSGISGISTGINAACSSSTGISSNTNQITNQAASAAKGSPSIASNSKNTNPTKINSQRNTQIQCLNNDELELKPKKPVSKDKEKKLTNVFQDNLLNNKGNPTQFYKNSNCVQIKQKQTRIDSCERSPTEPNNSDDVQLLTQGSSYVPQFTSEGNNSKEYPYNNSGSNKKQAAYKDIDREHEKEKDRESKPIKYSPALNPSRFSLNNEHDKESEHKNLFKEVKGKNENMFLIKQPLSSNQVVHKGVIVNQGNSGNQAGTGSSVSTGNQGNTSEKQKNTSNIMRNSTDISNLQNIENNKSSSNSNFKYVKNNKQPSAEPHPKKCELLGNKEKEKEVKVSNQLNQQANCMNNQAMSYNIFNHQAVGFSSQQTYEKSENPEKQKMQDVQFNNISNANYIANLNLNINTSNPNFVQIQQMARQHLTNLDHKKMFNDNLDSNADYMEEKLKSRLSSKNQNPSNKSFNNSGGNTSQTNKKNIKMKKTKSNAHISEHMSMEEAISSVSGGLNSGVECKRSSSNAGSINNNESKKIQRGNTTNVLQGNQYINQRPESTKKPVRKDSDDQRDQKDQRDKSKDREIDLVKLQLQKLEDKINKSKKSNSKTNSNLSF